jgi:hypothetical protein
MPSYLECSEGLPAVGKPVRRLGWDFTRQRRAYSLWFEVLQTPNSRANNSLRLSAFAFRTDLTLMSE